MQHKSAVTPNTTNYNPLTPPGYGGVPPPLPSQNYQQNMPNGLQGQWNDKMNDYSGLSMYSFPPPPPPPPVTQTTNPQLKRPYPETPKTPSKPASVMPHKSNPELPKELRDMFQPLFCKLCSAQMNSTTNALVHYKSKGHEKKIKRWLEEWCEKTGEPMPKRASVDNSDDDPKYKYCEPCDLKLTSKLQAEQHYIGKNHQKVIMGLKNPSGSGFIGEDGKWKRCIKAESDPTGRFGIGMQFTSATTPEQPVSSLHCSICNIDVTSKDTMAAHLSGQKHAKNVRKLGNGAAVVAKEDEANPNPSQLEPDNILASVVNNKATFKEDYSIYRTPSGQYYCSHCNITVNSEITFHQHSQSKKHLRKKNK